MNILIDNKTKNKNILRLALILVLILILGIVFFYTWINNYNKILRFPYVMKGNVFLMIVYMVIIYIFMLIYDCNNISQNSISNLIFSETLAFLSCNILVYFVMIIPAAALGLMPIMPLIYMCIIDFVVVLTWAYIVSLVTRRFFPPKKILLITSKNSIDEIVMKFSKRNDLYEINDKIIFDDNINEIFKKCDTYNDILIGDIKAENRNDIIKHSFNNDCNVYVVPKISDILLKYSDDVFVFDTPIYLSANFSLSLENIISKRLIDIIISLIVIIVFFPIWLIVAFLIKIEDGGPIFFTQERITYDEKSFNIIKFRSMKVGSDSIVAPTLVNDDRITKIGSFIRKYHIDEIPQFLNVLKGDMSVVGPRPERIEHVKLYSSEIKEFKYRFKIKAGITGLAQIYGKYNTTAIDKLKLDLIYIKKYSFMFDLELILRTLKVLIIKDNSEGFDKKTGDYITKNAC